MNILRRSVAHALILVCTFSLAFNAFAQKEPPTDWGWPQPYNSISPRSIETLKQKGMWPVKFAWQPSFSGQNATVAVAMSNDLFGKRGLSMDFSAVASGVLVNKALIEGKAQVGAGGNFPLTLLIDKQVPVRVVAVTAPNLKHQVLVKADSPIKSMQDLIGKRPPLTIGLVLGSSAEFYFQATAVTNRIKVGYDVELKNVPLGEQAKALETMDAVIPWDPVSSTIVASGKARAIDVSYPYNVYQGSFFVHKDIIDDAPDVAQAITEALVEADLWLRKYPDKGLAAMVKMPEFSSFTPAVLKSQISQYNLLYKPTYMYPLGQFWGGQNQDIALWLSLMGRLNKILTARDYENYFEDKFMKKIYSSLGWKIPSIPPFIPAGWSLKNKNKQATPYLTIENMSGPQPWPEAGDLLASAGSSVQPQARRSQTPSQVLAVDTAQPPASAASRPKAKKKKRRVRPASAPAV
jgi:ABC-type nitrate/sulfonate/bicarbonate transport system substrate-binding protein